ncbi:MAG: SprT-like domain-containing protein [Bacteroidia bacterium]
MTREELFEKNKKVLSKYIPPNAVDKVCHLIFQYDFKLIIKGDRKSKWGDFKVHPSSKIHTITINVSLNPYAFLITLIHEIAHCKTYREYEHKAEAHGKEWKKNFQYLMKDFLNTDVFPVDVLHVLKKHMEDPCASAHADIKLYKVLMNYDEHSGNVCLVEYLKDGDKFEYNHQTYQRIAKRRKKIECLQLKSGKKYLFSPIAEVKPIIE